MTLRAFNLRDAEYPCPVNCHDDRPDALSTNPCLMTCEHRIALFGQRSTGF